MRHSYYGEYGGQYVSEALMNTLYELEVAFTEAIKDPEFMKEYHYYLKEYVGSIIIEQEKNQKNKNLFYLYIKFKNKEVEDIFQAEDMFKFVLDISNSTDISRLEEIVEILSSKEKLLLEAFLNNESYQNIIKDALAYRYLGLVENKIKRKETEKKEKFFKELNVQISIDDKGNLVYNKMYF